MSRWAWSTVAQTAATNASDCPMGCPARADERGLMRRRGVRQTHTNPSDGRQRNLEGRIRQPGYGG
jgi:hypothetical protein